MAKPLVDDGGTSFVEFRVSVGLVLSLTFMPNAQILDLPFRLVWKVWRNGP